MARTGCTCDRVHLGAPYARGRDCPHCWAWHHRPEVRRARGGDPAECTPVRPGPVVALPPCRHLGAPTGEVRPCQGCATVHQVAVMACVIHGICSVDKLLSGIACCAICKQREAAA